MRSLRSLAVAAALLACGSPFAALAEPTPEDRALAAVLFQRARKLVEDGHHEDACPLFEESERLDPGGGTLLNLALCHEAIGKTGSAWGEFLEARAVARRDENQERLDIAEQHIASLTPKLANLVVEVPPESRVEGLEISRDGRPLSASAWGIGAPVDPGSHTIVANATNRETWTSEIDVEPGPSNRVVTVPVLVEKKPVAPLPQPVVPVLPVPYVPPHAPPRRPAPKKGLPPLALAGIGVGSVGLASLSVGAAAGIAALLKRRASEEAAPTCDPGCSAHAVDLNDQAKTAADVSTATFVAGGVLAAGGLTMLLVGIETVRGPAQSQALSLRWTGQGALLTGSF